MFNHRVRSAVITSALIVWTGCSSPTRPAEVVPAPVLPLPVAPDVRPAAGTHPYRLTLQFPPCSMGYGPVPEALRTFATDAELVVQGNSLTMTLPQSWATFPALTVTIQRTGNQLSGTIGGRSVFYPPSRGPTQLSVWLDKTNNPRVTSWEQRGDRGQIPTFTGAADNDGRIVGTFDGYFETVYLPGSGGAECTVQTATFTLEPRS